eukprot:COSAG01_NODE_4160_length_5287_cov_12.643986_5_plen_101_part_00
MRRSILLVEIGYSCNRSFVACAISRQSPKIGYQKCAGQLFRKSLARSFLELNAPVSIDLEKLHVGILGARSILQCRFFRTPQDLSIMFTNCTSKPVKSQA